jgi:hypothetical protein
VPATPGAGSSASWDRVEGKCNARRKRRQSPCRRAPMENERGLLHPFIDYDAPPPRLNRLVDPMDAEVNVHISPDPGLVYDINWDYFNSHLV